MGTNRTTLMNDAQKKSQIILKQLMNFSINKPLSPILQTLIIIIKLMTIKKSYCQIKYAINAYLAGIYAGGQPIHLIHL
jgi:hypothetical protein